MEEDIHLPRKGDKLFKECDDWWNNAYLYPHFGNWHLIAIGYKLAADILAKHIIQTKKDQDFLVYPIAFLYRQYIELNLKDIIRNYEPLKVVSIEDYNTHDLYKLWRRCKRIFKEEFPDESKDDLDVVEECISQFCQIDPFSQSFRYPVDKKGKQLLTALKRINIRNLFEVMKRLSNLLEGYDTALSVYKKNIQ